MTSGIRDSECFGYGDMVDGAREQCTGGASLYSFNGVFQTAGLATAERGKACIVLIDPRPLTRTSISRLLSGGSSTNRRSEDFAVRSVSGVDELFATHPANGAEEVALIVLNLGALCPLEVRVRADHRRLRDEFPGVPLVILSDCENPKHILGALQGGVRGYIPSALESSMVIHVIRLVLAGGVFIPPGVIAARADKPPEILPEHEGRELSCEFTPRQTEVFELLRQGRSNKVIAYELGMQESTVKVHVRQIMRKLKAINRTHAVFLATRLSDDNLA
jgi:DNA-binding NarL/FixJ family response regulator